MKKLVSWKNLAIVLLACIGIGFSVFAAQPSKATSANYQRMIELGFIDEVKSPEELGLEYLRQKPPELTASLVDNIKYTRELAGTQMTDNISYAIPLGTNSPFAAGQLRNDDGGTINAANFEGVGSVTNSAEPEPVTGGDVVEMFTVEERNGGSFDIGSGSRQTLVADASSSFFQARRVAIIDLIVRDKRNGRYYLLPNVRVDSFCRDALNSVRNQTFHRHNAYEVRKLNLRRLRSLRF
ncbi:hypothetical protein [Coleofasciculus sp. F4-SAH-05]|jgi:hypothetical protein|uniref:hypothetical protein n=1 Tax=Coleofasciculus sp. F4-SAH-05 TaxID=3069525 RepID=UPI0032F14A00